MSCKVLARAAQPASSRPLFSAAALGSCDAATTAKTAEPSQPGHVAELHARIMDLEQALQTNVRQAREAGYREGEKAGRERAAAEVQPVLERLARSLSELATLRRRMRRESEQDLVALSIAIARRILRRELSVDPEAVHGVVKAALEKVQARELCRIRIHPEHAGCVRKHVELSGIAVEVHPDAALQPGDVIVETPRGDLDASVETQLREIERGFADRLREAG